MSEQTLPSKQTSVPEDRASIIIFYCKDCKKIVETEKVATRYVYHCKLCGGKNVAFGTEKSIKNFFHINV